MNKNKFKNEYLASLYGHTWDERLSRTFPRLKKPHIYKEWDSYHKNKSEIEVNASDKDRIWFCSDHHFIHRNIIKYANRPYDNPDQMNHDMMHKHNSVVGEDDIVFMLGDIGMGYTGLVNEFLDKMNGYKILIIGNHDWEKGYKLKNYHVDEMYVSYYLDWAGIMMTHAPFDSYIPFAEQFLNAHGHIHNKIVPSEQYRNVCVEHTNYTPISYNDLVK